MSAHGVHFHPLIKHSVVLLEMHDLYFVWSTYDTAQKMKFSIKDFFSKCDQIRRKLRIWSHLLKKFVMENFIFCVVKKMTWLLFGRGSPQWNDYCSVLVFFNLRSIKLVKILFNWRIYSLILQVLLVLLTLYFAMSCICCSIFKVCLTILRHFEVKGFNIVDII